jgi:hypothetical protein
MTTTFVGIKELRKNMSKITTQASKRRQRVIVLRKNAPLFELRPLSKEDMALWSFDHDIKKAQKSARAGKAHSTKEVRKMLGLKPYEV